MKKLSNFSVKPFSRGEDREQRSVKTPDQLSPTSSVKRAGAKPAKFTSTGSNFLRDEPI
jgi:hypothetical protein